MNVLILFGHPRRTSFSGAVLDALSEGLESVGHIFEIADLYSERSKVQRDSIRFGKKVTSAGKLPSKMTARMRSPKNGAAARVTVHISRPLIPCSTKRLKPTGGVI